MQKENEHHGIDQEDRIYEHRLYRAVRRHHLNQRALKHQTFTFDIYINLLGPILCAIATEYLPKPNRK